MSLIVKIPNSQKADHETPGLDQNGLVFKSPTISIWVGSTGAGKTMAAANAIAHNAGFLIISQSHRAGGGAAGSSAAAVLHEDPLAL